MSKVRLTMVFSFVSIRGGIKAKNMYERKKRSQTSRSALLSTLNTKIRLLARAPSLKSNYPHKVPKCMQN